MHPNADVIQRFYICFQSRDGDGMAACYHPDARFSDPVFTDLRGAQVGAMWRMLCTRAEDLRVDFGGVEADDRTGRAHWEAWYTFTATGRPVHNVISAEFEFDGGLIMRHRDTFDFWRWSSQALGPSGRFLGWTPFVRRKVQRVAAGNLARFIEKSATRNTS